MAYQTAEISCAARDESARRVQTKPALPNNFCFTSFTQHTNQRFLKVFTAKEFKWKPHSDRHIAPSACIVNIFTVDGKITEERVRSQNIRIVIILVITPKGPFHCDYGYISDCQHRSAHYHSTVWKSFFQIVEGIRIILVPTTKDSMKLNKI